MTRTSISSLFLLLIACEGNPSTPPSAPAPEAPTPPKEAPALSAKAPEAPIDLEAVPVEEDFELEAETTVNAGNLAATLDALEKELEAK